MAPVESSARRMISMFKKILVCLDGSGLAEQILPYAVAEAKSFEAQLVLFQATPPPASITLPGLLGYIGPGAPAYVLPTQIGPSHHAKEAAEREAHETRGYLGNVAEGLQRQGLAVETEVAFGDAGHAIVAYAADHDIDLIAIASRGHGGLERLVFGSVAEHVLRESCKPILVIKPEGK
jgi:nucleotide-binding universal stress UspA family protein